MHCFFLFNTADGEDVVYALSGSAAKTELSAATAKYDPNNLDNCFLFRDDGEPTDVSLAVHEPQHQHSGTVALQGLCRTQPCQAPISWRCHDL